MFRILFKLTPLEPYFLGGERIHEINDGNKHYFIRSLDTPSQTTLFGALRYIGIKNPQTKYEISTEDRENIGTNSYKLKLLDNDNQNFGRINSISPLYLVDKDRFYWIPTPFDHIQTKEKDEPFNTKDEPEIYSRFEKYSDPIETNHGQRCFPMEYDAKIGVNNGWLCLENRYVRRDLFQSVTQVGVDKQNTKQAFFKKEYKRLENGFSFAFFADVAEGFVPYQRMVYLGQGKSPFQVEWSEIFDEPKIPKDLLKPGIAYAHSDIFCQGDIQSLYNCCQFVCAKTVPHRIFEKDYRNRTGSKVVQLLQAGSVFWPNETDITTFKNSLRNEHASTVGLNQIIIGGNE